MNKIVYSSIIIFWGFFLEAVAGAPDFSNYFIDATMRIDYYHTGDANKEFVAVDQIYKQKQWAGSEHNLIDTFDNGRYYVKVLDAASNRLIYSKGFDSYFGEYKTSKPALESIKRTYHESTLIPFPKNLIIFKIEIRNTQNKLEPLFEQKINPESISIIKESSGKEIKVYNIVKNGSPHTKVDLALIAEGYTAREKRQFRSDLKKFTEVFFSQEPYKSNRKKFNIYGVFKASDESGVDEPRHNSFKRTVLNATFNSMGSERYLLTEDNKSLREIGSHVPYDALIIMVNHARYGGGGIYNLFCTFTTKNQWSEYLLLHEFGHSFAGLADEYYSSSTAYNDFYPRGIEPTEPNITALLNPPKVKWQELISPGIKIPTPWEKEQFDKIDGEYQKKRKILNDRIAELKRNRAPKGKIRNAEDESARVSREYAAKMDKFLKQSVFWGKVGAFEGAGYSSEGLFRPMLDCIMFSKGKKPYCKVCEQAILKMIQHYAE